MIKPREISKSKASKTPESVLIAVDIEGITGIYNKKQCTPYTPEWGEARNYITDDVNAAIRGLLASGVKNIIVRDLHGPGFNIRRNKLTDNVTCIQGFSWRPVKIFGEIPKVDCAIMVGFHAGPDQSDGFSPHICHKSLKSLKINGKTITEVELFSALLGEYNVPVVFLSADSITNQCVKKNMPWIHACSIPKKKLTSAEISDIHRQIELNVMKSMASHDTMNPLVWNHHVVDMITDQGHFIWESESWTESYTKILDASLLRKKVYAKYAILIPYIVHFYKLANRLRAQRF